MASNEAGFPTARIELGGNHVENHGLVLTTTSTRGGWVLTQIASSSLLRSTKIPHLTSVAAARIAPKLTSPFDQILDQTLKQKHGRYSPENGRWFCIVLCHYAACVRVHWCCLRGGGSFPAKNATTLKNTRPHPLDCQFFGTIFNSQFTIHKSGLVPTIVARNGTR